MFSQHRVCLSDALKGCEVTIPTVFGDHKIKITDMGKQTRHSIVGKGVRVKTLLNVDRALEE